MTTALLLLSTYETSASAHPYSGGKFQHHVVTNGVADETWSWLASTLCESYMATGRANSF
jgi:hypothetical protein